jgi:hypothetical protein
MSGQETLTGEEMLYLAGLPDELAERLTNSEAVALVREEPADWPQSLKEKMRPYADEELLEALSEPS